MPRVIYKATFTLIHKRKKLVIDGYAPEVLPNARDKIRKSTFCVIIDKLK